MSTSSADTTFLSKFANKPSLPLVRAAFTSDAPYLHRLSQAFVASGLLRPRSAQTFSAQTADFLTAEWEGEIIGCVGLRPIADTAGAVLYNFCVDSAYHRLGVGAQLLEAAVRVAERDSVRVVYTATTRLDCWFERHSFQRIGLTDAPRSWRAALDPARRSLLYSRTVPGPAEHAVYQADGGLIVP